jgi:Flp pilus assembly protein TadD
VAQAAAAYGDAASARESIRRSLDLERNLGTLLNSAFALAVISDPAGAQKLVDEAAKLPGASNEDAQRGVTLVNALIRLRQGEKNAIEAIPAPKDDNDIGVIFTLGVTNLAQGNAEAAAQQFRKIAERRAPTTSSLKPLGSLYYGRALAKLGKTDESRNAYDECSRCGRTPTRTCRSSSTRSRNMRD